MRVLIADAFQQSGIDALSTAGCEVRSDPGLDPASLPAACAEQGTEVLIVRSTKVPAPVFEEAASLGLVIRAGAGVDNIDVAAASASGVFVANCPGKNSVAVAELAWGLILGADRLIPQQTAELERGMWNKKKYAKARGLMGRTLGVVGTGSIGRAVIERAHAFGMPVVAWSRSLDDRAAKQLGVERVSSHLEVAQRSDVVSLHVAGNAETKHLVDAEFLGAMKDGAILVNTTRGSVVDQVALVEAMQTKGIRAGLDVYENEPSAKDTESTIDLAKLPGFVGTHHVGASTDQAQEAIAEEAVRVALVFRETGNPPNTINRAARSRATRMLVVRHHNRPGVLAHVIGAIGKANINIEEMENIIYDGGAAACARLKLGEEPSPAVISEIREKKPDVLSADLAVLT